jgi:hypothetical protein
MAPVLLAACARHLAARALAVREFLFGPVAFLFCFKLASRLCLQQLSAATRACAIADTQNLAQIAPKYSGADATAKSTNTSIECTQRSDGAPSRLMQVMALRSLLAPNLTISPSKSLTACHRSKSCLRPQGVQRPQAYPKHTTRWRVAINARLSAPAARHPAKKTRRVEHSAHATSTASTPTAARDYNATHNQSEHLATFLDATISAPHLPAANCIGIHHQPVLTAPPWGAELTAARELAPHSAPPSPAANAAARAIS